ncbi:hypothetical protein NXX56_23125 [Bacteroides thetaiotaomicron]|nr:hypothetical protein [Bacteroides thetaiotaomicron]
MDSKHILPLMKSDYSMPTKRNYQSCNKWKSRRKKVKFYNNDGQAHIYRFAITPDNRAFIYRDGIPVDSVRIIDYAPQPNFAEKVGKPVENLLKNPNFEGEFDINPETKLVSRVEGWDVVISDRWNSEQQILPEEIDNNQDLDNHVFEIRPYKWAAGWSDGILMQVVDVVPNENYTLSALLKGGIAKKEGKLTGKNDYRRSARP